MNRLSVFVLGLSLVALIAAGRAGVARAGEEDGEPQPALALDLVDGSRLVGTPLFESVPLQTPYAKFDLFLTQVAVIRIVDDHETAEVDLRNGDRLKGVIDLKHIELKTAFGKFAVDSVHIRELRVTLCNGTLPAGEGPLAFGGVNWQPWRTAFEMQGDKLVSLPKARPGSTMGMAAMGAAPGS
jgi:hypothetical protein